MDNTDIRRLAALQRYAPEILTEDEKVSLGLALLEEPALSVAREVSEDVDFLLDKLLIPSFYTVLYSYLVRNISFFDGVLSQVYRWGLKIESPPHLLTIRILARDLLLPSTENTYQVKKRFRELQLLLRKTSFRDWCRQADECRAMAYRFKPWPITLDPQEDQEFPHSCVALEGVLDILCLLAQFPEHNSWRERIPLLRAMQSEYPFVFFGNFIKEIVLQLRRERGL